MNKNVFLSIFLSAVFVFLFAGVRVNANNDLLWESLAESETFFSGIRNYVVMVEQNLFDQPLLENAQSLSNVFEVTYVKPGQYYFGLRDNDSRLREFIFVEGETHRQFIYPKEFKISGEGSFLYNEHVISITDSSLDFFYKRIIPLLEKERDNIECRFEGVERTGEAEAANFIVTFKNPVDIQEKNVKSIELTLSKEKSIPQKMSFYNPDKLLVLTVSYESLKFDIELSDTFFTSKITEKQLDKKMMVKKVFEFEDKVMEDETKLKDFVLELSRIAVERYSEIDDYSADFIRQERVENVMNDTEYFFIKFRKPFDLYLRWTKGKRKDWELLYARGKYNNQVVVHVTGLANLFLPTLELDPAGGIAMMNNRHSILEFGIGYLIENYYRDIKMALEKDEVKLEYLGEKEIGGRPCWGIEAVLPEDSKQYYCYKSRLYFDKECMLPIKSVFYEWKDGKEQLIEIYKYENLSLNNGFTDNDFDRKNKEYDF